MAELCREQLENAGFSAPAALEKTQKNKGAVSAAELKTDRSPCPGHSLTLTWASVGAAAAAELFYQGLL